MKTPKILMSLLAAGLITVNAIAGEVKSKFLDQFKKPNFTITRVQNQEAEPVNRVEVCGEAPHRLDYYAIAQEQEENNFYLARLQYVPIDVHPFGLGIAMQYQNSNLFPEQTDLGIVGRIKGKPTDTFFGQLDLRYFPKEETFNWYGFLDSQKWFGDCVGSYNPETKNLYIQPGLDFKVNDILSVGAEGNLCGEPSNLDKQYIGLRAKIKF